MRRIERTSQFKRDFKKHGVVDTALVEVLYKLLTNEQLPQKYADHALSGEWADHRDCHLRPDLVLIYRLPDDATLQLVRLGSHSEIGIG
jgi:mRNA interferase YafQ